MHSKSVMKSVIENSGLQKSLKTKVKVSPEFTFVD